MTSANSVFQYKDGQTTDTFQDRSFRPVFLADVDAGKMAEAEALCGDSTACRFDFIATEEKEFAKYSLAKDQEVEQTRKALSKLSFY